jgi:hypothetical protein
MRESQLPNQSTMSHNQRPQTSHSLSRKSETLPSKTSWWNEGHSNNYNTDMTGLYITKLKIKQFWEQGFDKQKKLRDDTLHNTWRKEFTQTNKRRLEKNGADFIIKWSSLANILMDPNSNVHTQKMKFSGILKFWVFWSTYCIHASINSIHWLINLEDEGSMMLWNVRNHLPCDATSWCRRSEFWTTPLVNNLQSLILKSL